MGRYAIEARKHWQATFPDTVAGLRDPDTTFRQLEQLVERRLTALGSGGADGVLAELVLLAPDEDPGRVLRLLPVGGEPAGVADRLLSDVDAAMVPLLEVSAALRAAVAVLDAALAARDPGDVAEAVAALRAVVERYAAAQGAARDAALVVAALCRLRGQAPVPAIDVPLEPLPVLPEPPADDGADRWRDYRAAVDSALAERTDRLRRAAGRVVSCWRRAVAVARAGGVGDIDPALADVRRRGDALIDGHGEWAAALVRARAAQPRRRDFTGSLLALIERPEPAPGHTGPGWMSVRDARGRYPAALLFAAEVSAPDDDLVGSPASPDLLRDAYVAALFRDNTTWEHCDDPGDSPHERARLADSAAESALRATVRYQAAQQAHTVPVNRPAPAALWPDVAERTGELHAALVFAAECAEDAWPGPLDEMLHPVLRDRLDTLLAAPAAGEPYRVFEDRIRYAVRLTDRYRTTLRGLFGDRMWAGRPLDRWWCPDGDVAVHGSFHDQGPARRPTYGLRLHGPGRATLAVAVTATAELSWYTLEVSADGPSFTGEPHPDDLAAARAAVQALGRSVRPPATSPPEAAD